MHIPFQILFQKIRGAWQRKGPAPSLQAALAVSRLHALQQNIREALRFLRKKHLGSFFYRQKLPWYIVLGSSQTGKTSLLATSGLPFVSTNAQPLEHIAPTDYCQWFFGKEAIFIDTSGSLMLPQPIDITALDLWKKCIQLLSRSRHFHPLDGIILALDIVDFQTQSFEQRRQYVDTLLHHLQAFSHPIPVYILLTRCDRLQGFTEFFHMHTLEEREQICGISMPPTTQQDFASCLEAQYNRFLERLNQQILPYIHRERDIKKRAAIKNFPLQIEAQKRTLTQLSNQLHSATHPIQGIYFTSSQQEGMQNDALLPLLDTFGFPEQPNTSDRPLQKNAFFIKNTLQKIIRSHTHTHAISKSRWGKLQTLFYTPKFSLFSTTLFTGLLLLTLSSYWYNRQAVQKIHTILTEYQMQQQADIHTHPLFLIDTLQNAQQIVQYAANPLTSLIFHQAYHLKTQLTQLYRQALDNTFAPKLEAMLEDALRTDTEKKSPWLFDTLRLYLMMGDTTHRERDFIDTWFIKNIPSSNTAIHLQHIHTLLEKKSTRFHNTQLVQAARETLQEVPPKNIVYLHLEEKYKALAKKTKNTAKNVLYAPENFKEIAQKDIPEFVQQTLKEDAWVLGEEKMPDSLANKLVAQLSKEVQQLYITRYITFWTTQLTHLTVPPFHDLQEAKLFAASLNTSHSLLIAPLTLIQKNLRPVAETQEGQKIWEDLTRTRAILEKNQNNPKAQEAIKKFIAYIDTLLGSRNTAHTIFMAAQKRMRVPNKDPITQLIAVAKEMPAPMDTWLTQLATNTWQTMLDTSKNQLNMQWQSKVLPAYHDTIANRYPVFKEATEEEISLSAFSAFFGPGGVLEDFFTHNLAPFVDAHTLYWQWKKVDSISISIPQTTLEMFNRAALIRKMYFVSQEKNPSVKFSLTPSNLELISENFSLAFGEQSLHYTTDFKQAKQFSWPDKKSENAVLEKNDMYGKKIYFAEKGPWALFRLFGQGNLINLHNNTTLYQLEFNLPHQKVTYDLSADRPINAFMPHILTAFRCPERL